MLDFCTLAIISAVLASPVSAGGPNQTADFSPIETGGTPFTVSIEQVEWTGDALPTIQSTSYARYDHYLIFVGGRTSGVHGFDCDPNNNFMPKQFNDSILIVDYLNEHVYTRSLSEGDLSEFQIADLSSTKLTPEEAPTMKKLLG